jgi:hypothetical protein
MGIPIRISEKIYNAAKQAASAKGLSIPNQIEHWVTVGKCALENPDLPVEFICHVLASKNTDRNLAELFL